MGDLSDLSISSDDQKVKSSAPSSSNKFIKKKTTEPVKNDDKENRGLSTKFSKTPTSSTGEPQTSKTFGRSPALKSAALKKAAAYTSKYASRDQKKMLEMSDSDLDLDMSMDEEVLADVQNRRRPPVSVPSPEVSLRRSTKQPVTPQLSSDSEIEPRGSRFGGQTVKSLVSSVESVEDPSLDDLGKGGSRFLKKKKPATQDPTGGKQAAPVKLTSEYLLLLEKKYERIPWPGSDF